MILYKWANYQISDKVVFISKIDLFSHFFSSPNGAPIFGKVYVVSGLPRDGSISLVGLPRIGLASKLEIGWFLWHFRLLSELKEEHASGKH